MVAMRNAGGYVRVYRSLLDWEWYDDDACVRVMLHLLLSVNWEPKEWHGQKIEAGQLVTSIERLSEKLRLSRSTIRRVLDKLKSTGELTIQTNNHWTTVTLGNWAEYQEVQPTNGRQVIRPTTNRRPTADQPAATTKEGEALEEGKKGIDISARRDAFKDRCADAVAKDPGRLPSQFRQGFFDYWTEPDASGKMRFEAEKYFSIGRRMDTWKANAVKRGDLSTAEAGLPKPVWNPRA